MSTEGSLRHWVRGSCSHIRGKSELSVHRPWSLLRVGRWSRRKRRGTPLPYIMFFSTKWPNSSGQFFGKGISLNRAYNYSRRRQRFVTETDLRRMFNNKSVERIGMDVINWKKQCNESYSCKCKRLRNLLNCIDKTTRTCIISRAYSLTYIHSVTAMLQTLSQFLGNCFREVHNMELKSIAIPAIGTGNLLFPHRLVATVMLMEFRKFSRDHPQTLLRDVRFVVHPKDIAIIQVHLSTITINWNHCGSDTA